MRVRRRRGIHVLMGTLALVAGCSTAQRAEVRGTVRDRATGRVIAGARVVGADGSLAETDAEGRFHLYVNGVLADVRISAAGHSPEHLEIEGLDATVDLAPIDETWGAHEESAHVVGFAEETWTLDAGVVDATTRACTETSLAQAHSEITCGACHDASSPASSCVTCHASEAQALESSMSSTRVAPHAGLAGTCLACHSEIASHGDARTSCARCHGSEASTRTAELGRFFALATSSTLPSSGTLELRSTLEVPMDGALVASWARALARDRSGGAHDPRTTLTLGRALATGVPGEPGRHDRVASASRTTPAALAH